MPQYKYQPIKHSISRARVRCRGRGVLGASGSASSEAGRSSSTQDYILSQVRAQRQVTKSRLAHMPTQVRKELTERKRFHCVVQLERMLLPDAPPRKRRTQNLSPERHPVVYTDESAHQSRESRVVSPQAPKIEPEGQTDFTGIGISGSDGECPEPLLEVVIESEADEASAEVDKEDVLILDLELYPGETKLRKSSTSACMPSMSTPRPRTSTPKSSTSTPRPSASTPRPSTSTPKPSTSTPRPSKSTPRPSKSTPKSSTVTSMPSTSTEAGIGFLYKNFDETVTDWLDSVPFDSDDNNDDHDDVNVQDVAFPLATMTRTAFDNPADNDGLSSQYVLAINAIEEADNQYVRELAPSSDYFDFDWTQERRTFTGTREDFTGSPGPTFPMTVDLTTVDIFYKMFDDDLLTLIVTETNRYADQIVTRLKLNPDTKKNTRVLRWTPTDRNEMVAFLAVIILQGLYPKVKEECYFTFDGYGTTPYFGRIMTYSRYYMLKRFLHFVDNETMTDTTKLNKLQPLIDYFNDKFSGLYMPGREIAIDESLLKWHGRLSFAQKISSKATQVGVKTYELCESSSGYLWAFRVYTGKAGPDRHGQDETTDDEDRPIDDGQDEPTEDDRQDIPTDDDRQDGPTEDDRQDIPTLDDRQDRSDDDGQDRQVQDFRPTNATSKIVYDLMEPLLNKGHTLIMDNFYNSPLLSRCLKREKTDVFGTLRLSREFVPESLKSMTKSDMRPGEVAASYCSDLAVMLWRDANFVSMLSTYHSLQVGTSQKHNRVVYKPAIVLDYNKSMGGVDRKDQFLASQPLERTRNQIWYKKLFRRLFNVALFNSFIIFTSHTSNKNMTHRQFRIILAETLLKIYRHIDLKTEPRLIRSKHNKERTLTIKQTKRPYVESNHFPTKSMSSGTRCWICSHDNNRRTRTSYKCEECDVNLCIIDCFKAYHKPPRQ